ncbi:transmembrane protein, putative (macronuclear) [Tetrahymena thermophila SB210]|uniref:Transmembrane protein, putative n=1 Tax=Tetrahymena thermophila (strain SB210) TaxID=312017 RepID=W7XL70_TETTS|nr:transmembrane protein, putative [Tetrahymena thermophila SB210]EWS75774.1 transmembrane protein, putative [Tetrahymena thermophila SB210]|eukprot:XP_012651696.1 transmembrane protein, putative [Tetrahymena thermophila SB210]
MDSLDLSLLNESKILIFLIILYFTNFVFQIPVFIKLFRKTKVISSENELEYFKQRSLQGRVYHMKFIIQIDKIYCRVDSQRLMKKNTTNFNNQCRVITLNEKIDFLSKINKVYADQCNINCKCDNILQLIDNEGQLSPFIYQMIGKANSDQMAQVLLERYLNGYLFTKETIMLIDKFSKRKSEEEYLFIEELYEDFTAEFLEIYQINKILNMYSIVNPCIVLYDLYE